MVCVIKIKELNKKKKKKKKKWLGEINDTSLSYIIYLFFLACTNSGGLPN